MKTPQTISEIKHLLRNNRIAPLKKFGQHFLHDGNIHRKLCTVISDFCAQEPDIIIEIGPGLGSLTSYLLNTGPIVYCVEIDRALTQIIAKTYSLSVLQEVPVFFSDNSLVIEKDILSADLRRILNYNKKFFITGNIPYQITSPLLFKIMEWYVEKPDLFQGAVLVIQREVAMRINSKPDCGEYGLLSVLIQNCFHSKIPFHIQPNSFYPVPGVTSSCLALKPRCRLSSDLYRALKKLVKASFSHRRKKLHHNLKNHITEEQWKDFLQRTGHPETVRAENIATEEYYLLAQIYTKKAH